MTQTSETPMCEGSRDGGGGCLVCGAPLASTRARYCSRAHQQRAFRLRQHTSLPDAQRLRHELQRRRAVVAQTVYECPSCGERRVGERRCPDCNLFCRAIGLGGHCPECDTPLLWSISSEWRWLPPGDIHSGAPMGVDMTLCSSRAWITPAGVTDMPTPGATTTGAARCVSDTTDPTKKELRVD